jgi:aminopeptidase N
MCTLRKLQKTRVAFLAALFVLCLATLAPAQRRERVVDSWKPLHYDVSLSFDDRLSEISSARAEIALKVLKQNVRSVDLDFGDMPIDSVTVSGKPARYDRAPDLLNVVLPNAAKNGDKLNVMVTYHGRPKDGLIFATDRDGKPSVTGDNWPNRVHHWIPSLDHPSAKATVSFTIAAPPREVVVANGKFISMTRNGAAPTVWRFEETRAIPAYCMVIAVSEGAKIDASESTVTPLSFYVSQRDSSYAAKGFSSAAPALAFFSETVAPYPYEKLALIVGATRFGGMENSSAIVFASNLFDLRANEKMSTRFSIPSRIENVVAHEIAHQWFGDSVTELTWADLWLSEGFATYFAGLFIEKYEGEQAFREYLRGAAERYFTYEKRRNAPIHDTQTANLMSLLNENNYEKGAWVLHMLRKRLGDEAFFRGLRSYYNEHRESNATTEDVRKALEKSSGKNLRDFFARWVYGSGHPVYDWSSQAVEQRNGGNLVTITLKQTQTGPAFLDPVPVTITSEGKTAQLTIKPKGKFATAQIPTGKVPLDIQIDPDGTLLKELVSGQMVN